jgi:hypothetical protein
MESRRLPEDPLLAGAFAPARSAEPSDAEVAAVLTRATAPPPRLGRRRPVPRLLAPGLVAIAVFLAAAYAAPPTRAAIDGAVAGVVGVFDGWGSGDPASAPGRAVGKGEKAPGYFRSGAWSKLHEPRVIAETGGYRLYAYRESSGAIGFDLGDTGVGMGGYSAADFRSGICFLGPGTTDDTGPRGPRPFFGVAGGRAHAVRLDYADGGSETAAADQGGFVLLIDRAREPVAVTALDAGGDPLAREPLGSREGPHGPEPVAPPRSYC